MMRGRERSVHMTIEMADKKQKRKLSAEQKKAYTPDATVVVLCRTSLSTLVDSKGKKKHPCKYRISFPTLERTQGAGRHAIGHQGRFVSSRSESNIGFGLFHRTIVAWFAYVCVGRDPFGVGACLFWGFHIYNVSVVLLSMQGQKALGFH